MTLAEGSRSHDRYPFHSNLISMDSMTSQTIQLSKKAHPDIPGGDRAKFEQVAEAYSILGDDAKR